MQKLLYISILAFLFSCTKGGGNMYVEGKAYNPATGEGLENIKIQLWKEQPSSGYIGPSTSKKFVETTYTDADGNYSIKHTGIFQAFYLKVTDYGKNFPIGWVDISTKKKNYANVISINSVKMVKSKNMHADFQAVPYGYLKLSIHNVNCQGTGDVITIDMKPTYLEDYSAFQPLTGNGCYQNEFIESKVPSGTWEANWQITKNNVTTSHDTTFFIPGNGHYILEIDY